MSKQSQHPFKWRHFQADVILLCVRWYLRYSLSSRDLEEIMLERGLHVDHTTISRWVQRSEPELEKRCRPQLNACNDSRTGGRDVHHDQKSLDVSLSSRRFGIRNTLDFWLSATRDAHAAQHFFLTT